MGTKAKPACQFGANCYRKNPLHLESYSHPSKANEGVDAGNSQKEDNVRNKDKSPKARLRQTTLTFPQKLEFSSAPKNQFSNKKNVNVRNKKEAGLAKNKETNSKNIETVQGKRKRKTSVSENSRKKVKKPQKAKGISCLKGNDSSTNVIENDDGSDSDGEAVQSTSWTFVSNPSAEADDASNSENFTDKSNEEIIKSFCLVNMPPDFYGFYEFCKSVNETEPLEALQICDLNLVGPFDILAGKMNYSVNKELFLCHWRYYYDPPEFQTILATNSGLHFGYWRDDPKELSAFLASNNVDKGCTFNVEGENIFGTVFHYLNEFIKNCDPFKKVRITKLQNSLKEWAQRNKFSLDTKTSKVNERQKKVVSKTFHGAGIAVPVEPKSKIGYRPLIQTDAKLKRICELIMNADDEKEKDSLLENLQPLIAAANIANDECDFGNSLELGIDLFCMGSSIFHETIEHLLSTAYTLLDRTEFEKIIKAHLKFRRKGNQLSVLNKG